MRGAGERHSMHNLPWMLWSWLGGFLGIWSAYLVNRYLEITPTDQVMLIGSFGASAVLIYGAPHVPYAQPRNLVGGHVVSALVGVTLSQYLDLPLEILAALTVATAILLMHLTKTIHPPGGATGLIAIIGTDSIQQLGYWYVLQPVLTGVLAMLLVAVLVNNLSRNKNRHYPRCWL